MITWILIGGAVSGAGVLFLVLFLAPPAAQPAAAPKPGAAAGCENRRGPQGRRGERPSGRSQPLTDPAMRPPTKYLPSRM